MSMAPPAPPPPPVNPADYYGPPVPPIGPPMPPGMAEIQGAQAALGKAIPPLLKTDPNAELRASLQDFNSGNAALRALGFQGHNAPPPPSSPTLGFATGAPPPPAAPTSGPRIATGPTYRDDAELASFVASQKPKPVAHGGGGAPANPDPWGVKGAQAAVLGTYDAEKDAMRRMNTAEVDKAGYVAGERERMAREQQEDAAINHQEVEQAQGHFDQQLGEVQRQLDDVKAKKVDPTRLMQDGGMRMIAVIGGIFGGLYQGFSKSATNPFMDHLNRVIDRDVASQEKNIDNARANVNDRISVLGQQRAIFKDGQAAKLAARNMYYEAAKTQIEAGSARHDSAILQARGDKAWTDIDRAQKEVQLQLAQLAKKEAMARAGAQASMDRARLADMRKTRSETYTHLLTAGMSPEQAEVESQRMVEIQFGGGAATPHASAGGHGDPVSMVPKGQRDEASKELAGQAGAAKVVDSVGEGFKQWRKTSSTSPAQLGSTRSAIAGTIMAAVPGIRSDVDFKEIVEPNLPAMFDSEETLRTKEATIKRFVEAKTATPVLDRHAPGWRGPERVKREPVK